AKATTIKEALVKWEEKSGEKAGEAKAVKLYGQIPPVEKMDASLSTLINCEKLSLSTNCIEKIANLNGLKNLKILSLGRNNIKNLSGLEAVGDTLEELWISYNLIEKLKGIHVMKKLRVLYISNNLVKEWGEFVKLADLPSLVDLVFVGNPLEEKYSAEGTWIDEATRRRSPRHAYMDYESKMHPEKNVKVKEVITTLLKLLSAVGIGPVPTAETFRRAKFNKTEAAQDLWRLLNTLLMKVFVQDHECKEAAYPDLDSQFRFVSSALWHSGYRGWWVAGPRACGSRHEVGSRDLLLAFGWVMASGNLLVSLLGEKGLELELLSSAKVRLRHLVQCAYLFYVTALHSSNVTCMFMVSQGMHGLEDLALDLCACGMDGASCRQDVRTLQWQYGKLRLQWRSLIATQQEQAKLTHKVFSNLGSSSISEASVVDIPDIPRSTALDKDLEHIQCLNGILEAYLEWNVVEPLFWCWMDSVIDGCLSERCIEGSNDMPQGTETVTHSCSHVNKARRSVKHLDKMLLRLQTELRRVEPTRRALTQ
ncbi:hypothetical protein P4O66_011840, partial [Electrophorus voltai]